MNELIGYVERPCVVANRAGAIGVVLFFHCPLSTVR